MSVATRDITEFLPPGSRLVYDIRMDQYVLFVDGVCLGYKDRLTLDYATHMEFDRFFHDLKIELRMPRKMEGSRLWC